MNEVMTTFGDHSDKFQEKVAGRNSNYLDGFI